MMPYTRFSQINSDNVHGRYKGPEIEQFPGARPVKPYVDFNSTQDLVINDIFKKSKNHERKKRMRRSKNLKKKQRQLQRDTEADAEDLSESYVEMVDICKEKIQEGRQLQESLKNLSEESTIEAKRELINKIFELNQALESCFNDLMVSSGDMMTLLPQEKSHYFEARRFFEREARLHNSVIRRIIEDGISSEEKRLSLLCDRDITIDRKKVRQNYLHFVPPLTFPRSKIEKFAYVALIFCTEKKRLDMLERSLVTEMLSSFDKADIIFASQKNMLRAVVELANIFPKEIA